ncbi:hypothetical protein SAMN05421505_109189 [Sinosporangium album]|uniref:UPF0182 protein SAMN05421505_109189 n=2 Tax=Sinosporangium album TaxID=504805 RepID=A0A1G7YBU6_9ACTN|nr:hypothetical protein SAMN05421505_109189 [Sinosporangium album]
MPRRPRLLLPVAIALVAIVAFLFLFSGVYTDYLWFDSVDYTPVFSGMLWTQTLLFVLGAVLMIAIVGGNMLLAYRTRPMFGPAMFGGASGADRYRMALDPHRKLIFWVGMALLALFAGSSTSAQWKTWLLFINGQPFGKTDPEFGMDISFFMFTYPFLRMVLNFLFTAVIITAVLAAITHYLYGGFRLQSPGVHASRAARVHLSVLLGVFVLLKAVAYWVDRFGLVFSTRGKVFGASYTDINAVLPAKTILAIIALICALLFFAGIVRSGGMLPGVAFGLLVLSAILIGGVYPALVEQFQVKPNQQSRERESIQRNIAATRDAYNLTDTKVTDYSAKTEATGAEQQTEANTIPGVRLLDPSLMSPTFQQLQQIRGYYKFPEQLDIDRYKGEDGVSRDTIVATREIGTPPEGQQNWINNHLVYTHGFGFVAAPGNGTDANGRPDFVERDIPPAGGLGTFEPRIYFGENSPEYSIVGAQPNGPKIELDYPDDRAPNGQVNYTYAGKGGVPIGNFFTRMLYAVKYGEPNLILSSDVNSASRIMYLREPLKRVGQVAPFLTLDQDPYPAVANGRIVWIVDGYTTSDSYPYAERRSLRSLINDSISERLRQPLPRDDVNYMRNSVKATVDAYDGTVTLYAWDENDPVLKTWTKAFGGIVKPRSELDKTEIRQHVRYPEDMFKVQREMLAQYHVTDADAFYGGQDFWKVPADPATGKSKQPPYYLTMKMPGEAEPRFSLTSTFVPNQRQNMAAFMAVDATGDPNAKLQVLQLPSTTAIQGPEQAQNTFDSDPRVSTELNLLRGTGGATEVLNGNLLTLPFAGGLLYVEPVYVQPKAATSARYPTLQRVLVLFGDKVGFGPSLKDALNQVFGESGGEAKPPSQEQKPGEAEQSKPTGPLAKAIDDAQKAYADSEKALSADPPDWAGYGEAQKRLQDSLNKLQSESKASPAASPSPPATPTPTPSPSATPTPSPTGGP